MLTADDTRVAPYGFAFLKYDKCRYCLYTVAGSKFFVLVYIYFGDTGSISYFVFEFFQYRMHGLARATPGCKEIN